MKPLKYDSKNIKSQKHRKGPECQSSVHRDPRYRPQGGNQFTLIFLVSALRLLSEQTPTSIHCWKIPYCLLELSEQMT